MAINLFSLQRPVDSNQGQFQIDINSKGVVQGFNVIEQDGQQGRFEFKNVNLTTPNKATFTFE